MRFLQVPRGNGLWAWIYLTLGQALFFSGLVLFLLNILFSAVGLMEFMGATVNYDTSNLWFPFWPQFIDAGRGGLLIGIVAGIMTSAVQIRLLITPKDNIKRGVKSTVDKADLFIGISLLMSIYDYLSTHYALMGGMFFDMSNGIGDGIGLFLSVALITVVLFSIGSEMFMVYGMEMIITNWKQGSDAWSKFWSVVKEFVFNMFGQSGGDENESDDSSNVETPRSRGRPRKDDYGLGNEV